MDNEIFQISNFNYGHFDAGLGFSVRLLYLLHLDGHLGSQRFLMDAFLNATSNNQILAVLAVLAFVLLVVVTLGIGYLTAVEWRDRRRRGREAKAMPSPKGMRK